MHLKNGKTKIAVTGNVIFQIIKKNNQIIKGENNRSYDLEEEDKVDLLATKESIAASN